MKTTIKLTILLLFSSLVCHAERVTFAYDACGNRVKRSMVLNPSNKSPRSSTPNNNTFYDMVGDRDLTLTRLSNDMLMLEITDLTPEDECIRELVSMSGMVIMTAINPETSTIVDIHNQPTGIYVLSVIINDNLTTWKLIKK